MICLLRGWGSLQSLEPNPDSNLHLSEAEGGGGGKMTTSCSAILQKRKLWGRAAYCFPRLPRGEQLTARCNLLGRRRGLP